MQYNRLKAAICLFLIVSNLAVFWQVRNHDFVNLDDRAYVFENPQVKAGWTKEGLVWAFTSTYHSHWHPLTWLSHMTDCQFFGLNPKWHHLTSLFLHIANTLLLFLILSHMTGALLQSAFVAVLFAIHPLNVETVAWVADRKDILGAFFWTVTLWAYAHYSRRPGFLRYFFVLIAFILGLMSKSVVVTLPCILLLLDYWPLCRIRLGQTCEERSLDNQESSGPGYWITSARHLILEKAVFFFLLGAAAVAAVWAMRYKKAASFKILYLLPTTKYVANSLVNYAVYIGKMFWPLNLAVPYPPMGPLKVWQVAGAGFFLLGISLYVFWKGRKYPYLPVGWLWYLITLSPMIGIIQIGPHKIADRYTYIPLIGLFIMMAWGIPDLLNRWRYRKIALGVLSGTVISGLMICSWAQAGHWKDSFSLLNRTLSVTSGNYITCNNLGVALMVEGRVREAETQFAEALRINPDFEEARVNLGVAYKQQGRLEEALEQYYEVLRVKPRSEKAHYNLGLIFESKGNFKKAIHHYSTAVKLKPNFAAAHNNLGTVLANLGRIDEAIQHFSKAIQIDPDFAMARNNLEKGLRLKGKSVAK